MLILTTFPNSNKQIFLLTWDIGILVLTASIAEKSISATVIPVDRRSETAKYKEKNKMVSGVPIVWC